LNDYKVNVKVKNERKTAMITRWGVKNFKSIREADLELAPLTIFAGANSSGKSSLIQSMLMVAQTLADKIKPPSAETTPRSVILNGALVNLGQFEDVKSKDAEEPVAVKFRCSLREFYHPREQDPEGYSTHKMGCEFAFDDGCGEDKREEYKIYPRLVESRLLSGSDPDTTRVYFDDYDNYKEQHYYSDGFWKDLWKTYFSIRHTGKNITEIEEVDGITEIPDNYRQSLVYENERIYSPEDSKTYILKHFLPEKILKTVDKNREAADAIIEGLDRPISGPEDESYYVKTIPLPQNAIELLLEQVRDTTIGGDWEIMAELEKLLSESETETLTLYDWLCVMSYCDNDEFNEFIHKLRESESFSDRLYEAMKEANAGKPPRGFRETELSESQIGTFCNLLEKFFSTSFKYLGPLREAPKYVYPYSAAADPYNIGLRGEFTASVFGLNKNMEIRYIPSSYFENDFAIDSKPPVKSTLKEAVANWLVYLGLAKSIDIHDMGTGEVVVKADEHSLTHMGVGVSQALPIIVMCLMADEDSTLVFEQPELHLHPKVQTLLGDFFLSVSLCKKQCVLETHSEYLIDRLRYRIAASSTTQPEEELSRDIKIYFVEKSGRDSSFREVVINEYGAIPDWPDGFFDQSQEEAEKILRAALAKLEANRRKNDEQPL
jgi:predicted ATPase